MRQPLIIYKERGTFFYRRYPYKSIAFISTAKQTLKSSKTLLGVVVSTLLVQLSV